MPRIKNNDFQKSSSFLICWKTRYLLAFKKREFLKSRFWLKKRNALNSFFSENRPKKRTPQKVRFLRKKADFASKRACRRF